MPSKNKQRVPFRAALTQQATTSDYQKILDKIANPERLPDQPISDQVDPIVPISIEQPAKDQRIDQSDQRSTMALENQVSVEPSPIKTKSHKALVYYSTPITIDDDLMPTLNTFEQSLLRRLYRLSYGFNRQTTDVVSLATLGKMCAMSLTAVKRSITSLESRGLIKRINENKFASTGGNRYLVLPELGLWKPGFTETRFQKTHIKDDHEDLKKSHDHQDAMIGNDEISDHEREVRRIYSEVTGNTWKPSDLVAYKQIAHIRIDIIEDAIRVVKIRSRSRPNSLGYFVKEIVNLATPTEQSRTQRREALKRIVERLRQVHVGENDYRLADLSYDTKLACYKEGVMWDNDIFNEVTARG